MNDHLTNVSRLMSSEISAFLQIALHGFQCFTGNNRAAVCSVDEPENLSHLRDFSPSGYESYDVDAAVEHRDAGDQPLDAGTGSVNIQDGDYHCTVV